MGHLKRCLSIIQEGNSFFDSLLCIENGDERGSSFEKGSFLNNINLVKSPEEAGNIDLIFSDRRNTSITEMRKLAGFAPVISLDDLGAGKDTSHISILSLPSPGGETGNLNGPSYIVINPEVKKVSPLPPEEKKGVLVSFGGSDPGNLTFHTVKYLNELGITPTVIKGPFFCHPLKELDAKIIEAPQCFGELLNRAELLITSFGLTLYEAIFLGTPVLLLNQSFYHYQLSKYLSVPSIGYRGMPVKKLKENFKKAIQMKDKLKSSVKMNRNIVDGFGALRIASIIKSALENEGRVDCFFNHGNYKSVVRNKNYTLFRCRRCGDLFRYRFSLQNAVKNSQQISGAFYFLSEYKKKYGKTYIKDRENIRELGSRRLSHMEKLLKDKGRILDVGSALGFFIELAQENGWEASGVELFSYAAEWGKRKLGVDIQKGSFLKVPFKKNFFDAVTFFFVLEHFVHPERAVEKAALLLKEGGVLACALPNRCGISYMINRKKYLTEHPHDHYIDTGIKNLKKLLSKYGLKTRRVVVTGIHPSRFYNRIGIKKNSRVMDFMYTILARLFRLGDTFELYAVKTK